MRERVTLLINTRAQLPLDFWSCCPEKTWLSNASHQRFEMEAGCFRMSTLLSKIEQWAVIVEYCIQNIFSSITVKKQLSSLDILENTSRDTDISVMGQHQWIDAWAKVTRAVTQHCPMLVLAVCSSGQLKTVEVPCEWYRPGLRLILG